MCLRRFERFELFAGALVYLCDAGGAGVSCGLCCLCFSKAGVWAGCRWGGEIHVCTYGDLAMAASVDECCGVIGLENGLVEVLLCSGQCCCSHLLSVYHQRYGKLTLT